MWIINVCYCSTRGPWHVTLVCLVRRVIHHIHITSKENAFIHISTNLWLDLWKEMILNFILNPCDFLSTLKHKKINFAKNVFWRILLILLNCDTFLGFSCVLDFNLVIFFFFYYSFKVPQWQHKPGSDIILEGMCKQHRFSKCLRFIWCILCL